MLQRPLQNFTYQLIHWGLYGKDVGVCEIHIFCELRNEYTYVKGKVKFSLCLIEHHIMKTYRTVEI
jgi:hypothetical protein